MKNPKRRSVGVYLDGIRFTHLRSFARQAQEHPFSHLLFPEVTSVDPMTAATVCVQETRSIHVMPAIAGIWSRSPVNMALAAASNHDLAGERFELGLGLQGSSYVDQWHGRRFRRPVTAMREYVTILRRILSGGSTTYEGEVFRVRDFQLEVLAPAEVSIFVAAVGPQMVQLAGEIADGVFGYFYSPAYVREVVMPNLRKGLERAGRRREDVEVAAGIPAVITPDDRGVEDVKGQVLMFATAGAESNYYREALRREGFTEQLEALQQRVEEGEMEAALEAIPDEMANAATVGGSVDRALDRIRSYHEAGIDLVALNPSVPGGYYPLHEGHFPEGVEPPALRMDAYRTVVGDTINLLGPELRSLYGS